MKIPNIQLNPERFYRTGKYVFFGAGVIGLVRIVDLWTSLESYDIIGSIFSTVFQFALFAFFAHLQGKENIKELDDGDIFKMNEVLDKLNLEEKNVQKKHDG